MENNTIQLEKEAEYYWEMQYLMALDESTKPYIINDFIAGANSKYVQKQILEAQIKVIDELLDNINLTLAVKTYQIFHIKIAELKEQLKQLENGTK